MSSASFLAFLPALDGQWLNWDDETNFGENPHYRGLGLAQLRWMFTTTQLAVYIPLAWMTLGLNFVIGGMDPWGYHLGNLLLHSANAAVFFFVARALLRSALDEPAAAPSMAATWGAAAAALLFAVHPLRVESVAWVTERRDVQAGLFYLLSVGAYVRGVRDGALRGRWRLLSLVAFAAAILSKGLTMTLPLTLLVLDAYPLGRWRTVGWRGLVVEKLPHFALAAGAAVLAMWAVLSSAMWTSYDAQGVGARVAMTGYSFWFYPAKFLWPAGLSPLYPLPDRISLTEGRFLGALLVVAAITALLVVFRARVPGLLAAWAHSLIVVAPVSGAVHAGSQLANDRFSYLSGLGFALVGGGAVAWIARRREGGRAGLMAVTAVGALVVIVVLALGRATWEQTKVWHDSERLWQVAVAVDPSCMVCRMNLGNALLKRGHAAEAEEHVRRVIASRPMLPQPYDTLGVALAAQGRYPEAEAAFRQALRRSPDQALTLANLGRLYTEQGRWQDALPLLRRALHAKPRPPHVDLLAGRALRGRAVELTRAGRLDDAITLVQDFTEHRVPEAEIRAMIGRALVEEGAPSSLIRDVTHPRAVEPR